MHTQRRDGRDSGICNDRKIKVEKDFRILRHGIANHKTVICLDPKCDKSVASRFVVLFCGKIDAFKYEFDLATMKSVQM